MRTAPFLAIATGTGVIAGFLLAAVPQPHTTQAATVPMEVTFFLAVIGLQVAVMAGACAASRTLGVWRDSRVSGHDRSFVRRCTITSMTALAAGAVCLTANFVVDARHQAAVNRNLLAAGAAVMFAAAAAGLLIAFRLQVNGEDELDPADNEPSSMTTPALLRVGEWVIGVVRRHPFVACSTVALASAAWKMWTAEAPSVTAAIPWGIGEAAAVIVAFVLLGPLLGLRTGPDNAPAAA
jgi:hypothetical protein